MLTEEKCRGREACRPTQVAEAFPSGILSDDYRRP